MCRSAQLQGAKAWEDRIWWAEPAWPSQPANQAARLWGNEPAPIWPRPLTRLQRLASRLSYTRSMAKGCCVTAVISPRHTRSHVEIPPAGHGPGAHSMLHPGQRYACNGEDSPGSAEVTRGRLLVPWFFLSSSRLRGVEKQIEVTLCEGGSAGIAWVACCYSLDSVGGQSIYLHVY